MTLMPRKSSIKLKNLKPLANKSQESEGVIESSLNTVSVSGDVISIWDSSFQSLDTLSENQALLSIRALNKRVDPKELSEVGQFQLGSIELVNINPLLQKEITNFNQVSMLLDGFDQQSVNLINRIKKSKQGDTDTFCESCGTEIKSSILSFFVGLTRKRRPSADSARTRSARTAGPSSSGVSPVWPLAPRKIPCSTMSRPGECPKSASKSCRSSTNGPSC